LKKFFMIIMLLMALSVISLGCVKKVEEGSYGVEVSSHGHSEKKATLNDSNMSSHGHSQQETTLDDLVENADYIVVGKIGDYEIFNEHGTNRYNVEVNSQFKGESVNSIKVYLGKDRVFLGHSYLMFLNSYENPYYPHPIVNGFVFPIDHTDTINFGNAIHGFKEKNKEEVYEYITKSKGIKVTRDKDKVKDKSINNQDLIDSSDHIVLVKLTKVNKINKYAIEAEIEIVQEYKGDLKVHQLLLPPMVKAGEEYLVFLREQDYTMKITTRYDSVREKGSDEWIKIKDDVEKMKNERVGKE
jgi:hypothetical protein